MRTYVAKKVYSYSYWYDDAKVMRVDKPVAAVVQISGVLYVVYSIPGRFDTSNRSDSSSSSRSRSTCTVRRSPRS